MPEPSRTDGGDAGREALVESIRQAIPLLNGLDRRDLVDRLTAAAARLSRPNTVVCVVGEFKQGKSSLINGLLGMPVCPVDDDLATSAITLVRHGDVPSAVVRRRDGDQVLSEQVAIGDVARWVSEQGNPDNAWRVDRVDIAVPAAILRQGLALVDTPGMGGLGAGHAAATLGFLPFADGLLFVSDASAELSAPEVAFLHQATELCPTVLVVQTKTDLYPWWPRIVELNRGHLARAGVDVPIVAVSSSLRAEALARKDRQLNDRSGFPEVVRSLDHRVVRPAKERNVARSRSDLRAVVDLVRAGLTAERDLLADPTRTAAALAELEQAKARLDHLRGPGARWSVLVSDRLTDLTNRTHHDFKAALRGATRDLEERIERFRSGKEWDELARELQTTVADEVTRAFVAIERDGAAIRSEVVELLAEEGLSLPSATPGRGSPIDVTALWNARPLDEAGSAVGKGLRTGLSGFRGATGGVLMFGMVGNFLPSAALGLLAANPVLLGVGALFGGLQLADERKRKLAARRQGARTQVRQFLDEVQFHVCNELSGMTRELQRSLRDEFTDRLAELQRSYADLIRTGQENAQRSESEATQRMQQIDRVLDGFQSIESALTRAPA